MRSKLRLLPWISLGLGTVFLLLAFGLQGFELAGSTHTDQGPTVGRIYLAAFAFYGLGLLIWPFLPSFQRALEANWRQVYIGDTEPPGWYRRVAPVLVAAAGLIILGFVVTSWR